MIRGVLIQSCPTGAKNFTNYVFCHPQFSSVIQNIENRWAILTPFVFVDYYQNNQFYKVKIEFSKFCFTGTMIFGTLAWTIELYMTKYIIGEIFSSGRATLYKNPSDQTVSVELISGLISFINSLTILWGHTSSDCSWQNGILKFFPSENATGMHFWGQVPLRTSWTSSEAMQS